MITAKIMPLLRRDKMSDEEIYRKKQKFLFPQIAVPETLPQGIPNYDGLIVVSIDKDGKIKLNLEPVADLSSINILKKRLEDIFNIREEMHVYEPHSEKIVKAVGFRASPQLNYGEVIKVIDAVKTSGAEPFVLLIDDLPE